MAKFTLEPSTPLITVENACRICGEGIYGIGNYNYGACNDCTKIALNHQDKGEVTVWN
jgi:hypothetical protein